MIGWKVTPFGDWYRTVYYNGKRWTRVDSCGWWKPFMKGWTTVEHNRDRPDGGLGGVIEVRGL